MTPRRSLHFLLAGLCATFGAIDAWGQEDADLLMIPSATMEDKTPPTASDVSTAHQDKIFSENALGVAGRRNDLAVPLPAGRQNDAQARSSIDATLHRDWADGWSAGISDRLAVSWRNDVDFPSHQALANDLREAYVSWEPWTRSYVEAGRINLRNGIALGFNPTDFFKTRSLIDQASLDPQALRNNRLGTFMARGQSLWDSGSIALAVAPKLADASPLTTASDGGFGTRSDHTNAEDRFLVSLTQDLGEISPEVLAYREAGRTRFGLNLSHPVGQSVIIYGEWAGGQQASDIATAMAFAKRTGTLPASVPTPGDTASRFRNDIAAGMSWTSSAKVTLNLEYLEHQAGMSRQDWRQWFASGTGSTAMTGALWYIRRFASDQQSPLSRRQLFVRADWTDALISHLEFSAFAFVNLYDGSSLAQLSAAYDLSERWSMGAYLSANLGDRRSEHGSLPQSGSLTLQLIRYF
ncbi:hypothetical protein [Telmatospirillum sp.]|uniref:hypothetical protein n=1 Tax=Telmatospirillum sp. TaxID=2079197 RepID=UPI002840CA1D|nr:hypothetical protein [Telmatospirillum sp.]MDR3439421.1 hypothetical protein [Telmatospirillum sp.]